MNRKRLATNLGLSLALAAGSASAVSLNPKGLGQVLIYPYYTVNKNQDTLISVANASDIGKLVYVQVLEGYNGRDTLDFFLFLSPHDIWTAAISQTADDGGAVLTTTDTSCTYPTIPAGGVLLRSAGYDGTGILPADSGPQDITRTREGSIDLITAADIVPGSPTDVRITHVQTGNPGEGVPPGCGELTATNIVADEVSPTGGIYGSGSIVNVGEGTYFPYNADALAGFTDIPLWGNSGTFPSLEFANSSEAVGGEARAYLFDDEGRPLTLDYLAGYDAVSAVFMSDMLYNEYLVDAALGSNTDWIVTFPTKHFYVDDPYNVSLFARPPFAEKFANGQSNVETFIWIYDREEGVTTEPPQSCGFICPGSFPKLPYEVNAITFHATTPPAAFLSGVFGSSLTNIVVPTVGSAGTVTLDLADGDGGHELPGGLDLLGTGVTLRGLPATGFMSYNIINTQAQPGMLANYGGSFRHRATMSCTGPVDECDATNSGATGSR